MNAERKKRMVCLAVLVVALVLRLGLSLKLGMWQPMTSDAFYYKELAQSLAAGEGYVGRTTYWPGEPTLVRLPGWPTLVAAVFWLAPSVHADLAMRLLALVVDAAAAGVIALLTWRVLKSFWAAAGAGLIYAAHPTALYLAYDGDSEPFFILLATAGALLLVMASEKNRSSRSIVFLALAGSLLLGVSCLVRPNYLLTGLFLAVVYAIRFVGERLAGHGEQEAGKPGAALVLLAGCVVIFLLPALMWCARNARVTERFPVLSTLGGQTLYGGNNSIVANDLTYWGYWAFPDSVPGEKKMAELARTMSEYEVDRYYIARGLEYIKANWFSMPRLWLGKLVRSYVPVPWKPSWSAYALGFYRLVIYILAAIGLIGAWRLTPTFFRAFFLALWLTNIFSIVVFWGCARFAFPAEVTLLSFAGWAGAERIGRVREKR